MDSPSRRHLLVAAGTHNFINLDESDLPQVADEVERIVKSFCSLGYLRLSEQQSSNPTSKALLSVLTETKRASQTGDHIVVYYTGHGTKDEERFYILTHDADLSDLDSTALSAEELARALTKASEASQILVILDVCYAGAGMAEFTQIASKLTSISADGPALFVIAASRPKQSAKQGALVSALVDALSNERARLGGCTQEFLAIDDVMSSIDGFLQESCPTQTAIWSGINIRGRCQLFPNPAFQRELPAGLDLEAQRAFLDHWLPKARGAELGSRGWYFTGRTRALSEITEWLTADGSDVRIRIVTGRAGSGKSALLSRIVTLSSMEYRTEALASSHPNDIAFGALPPEGIVDVAVHARRKLLSDVLAEIASGLSLRLASINSLDLVGAIAERKARAVIVVDALDEADESELIVEQILRPLSKLSNVHLLIGSRRYSADRDGKFAVLGEASVVIDLDAPRYIGANDVATYAEARLLCVEEPGRATPYRNEPAVARLVAAEIANRANNVFLVAHTIIQALLSGDGMVDLDDRAWAERLPTGLDEAFEAFLAELDRRARAGLTARLARAVLLALAFAEGEGLPWVNLWRTAASALSGEEINDDLIAAVRNYAAAFIIEGVEDGRSVYRLYHEKLADLLRRTLDEDDAQRRLFCALRSTGPKLIGVNKPDWGRSHPYVQAHLVTHAVKGGLLHLLATDGDFLAVANPDRTIQALSLSDDDFVKRAYNSYSVAFDRLRAEPPDVRLSYLSMTARQQGDDELADIWANSELVPRWLVPWSCFKPVRTHRTIRTGTPTQTVALLEVYGRQLVAAGCDDGVVRVYDLATGDLRWEASDVEARSVSAVSFGTLDELAVLVSGSVDGALCIWDARTGRRLRPPIKARPIEAMALDVFYGRPVCVNSFGTGVQIWDLADGSLISEVHDLSWRYGRQHQPIALGTIDGRPAIIAGGQYLTVWTVLENASDGADSCKLIRTQKGSFSSVSYGEYQGKSFVVTINASGLIRSYDLASGKQLFAEFRSYRYGEKLGTFSVIAGRPIVSVTSRRSIEFWDIESGARSGQPLRGHQGHVNSLVTGHIEGRPVAVTGGSDATVRVWDLADSRSKSLLSRKFEETIASLAVGDFGGRPTIVTGGYGWVVKWDEKTGVAASTHHGYSWIQSVGLYNDSNREVQVAKNDLGNLFYEARTIEGTQRDAFRGRRGPRSSVGVIAFSGRPTIVSTAFSGRSQRIDLLTGQQSTLRLEKKNLSTTSMAWGVIDEQPVLVVGSVSGTIRIFDAVTGKLMRNGFPAHQGKVSTISFAKFDAQVVIISGGADKAVRVWDPRTSRLLREPLLGHENEVTCLATEGLADRLSLISGSSDGSIRLWSADCKALATVRVGSNVTAVAVSSSGNIVVGTELGLLVVRHRDIVGISDTKDGRISHSRGEDSRGEA